MRGNIVVASVSIHSRKHHIFLIPYVLRTSLNVLQHLANPRSYNALQSKQNFITDTFFVPFILFMFDSQHPHLRLQQIIKI